MRRGSAWSDCAPLAYAPPSRSSAYPSASPRSSPSTASVRRTDKVPSYESGGISVVGASTDLPRALDARLAHGTWLNAVTADYPTVVLGAGAAQTLGINQLDPSVAVWIGQGWFTVIGILKPVAVAPELDQAALIGIPAAHRYLGADTHPTTIYVRTNPDQTVAVRGVLADTTNPANPQDVAVSRPSDVLAAEIAAKGAYNTLLLGLGAIALIVGAVGIANVMVMAIIQRRTEIGLRRALGATRGHIATQFTAEALILSALGGGAGILAGTVITTVYAHARHWSTAIPPAVFPGALAAALAFGLVAALYPAVRAARLSPTDALRGTT
jgi:putative ABC transport system permease protein